MKKKTLSLLLLWAVCTSVAAQIVEPVHWSMRVEPQGDTAQVVTLTATIDEGWHLYDTELPDGGPLPTTFTFGEAELLGTTTADRQPLESYDENFEMTLRYYKGEVSFKQVTKEQRAKNKEQRTRTKDQVVEVRFMACNDEMCLPPTTVRLSVNGQLDGAERQDRETASASAVEQKNANLMSDTDDGPTGNRNEPLWKIFLLGLLAGLLAIFTPCVWPIIPMTVSFFMKRGGGLRSALLYGIAIIVIYVGLGLLVTVIFGASALNALSTNAVVNLIFFALLVVFALSFFGLFDITLPSSWSTHFDSRAGSASGFASILFMAFTLVIVSFSCTGPIIGTLLVEAAGRSLLAPAMGMLGFAIALALPFSLFAMFPDWLKKTPRSGDWMQSFKVVLAFLELALSLKFLSVADMAYGWGILPRWLFLALWIIIFFAIGVYLLVGIKKVSTFRKVLRITLIVMSWLFTAYLVPGLWGAPVRLVSAFAPPLPIEGRKVFTDFEEGMAYARQEQRPVLLDFTGVGCVNCRKMEAYVLADSAVQARLKEYVLIELYVDIKGGEGDRNSQLQRERFGANAQPYYIQLAPDGTPISEPYAFSTSPEKFIQWLDQAEAK